MSQAFYIYALVDPRDETVWYVGQTGNLTQRLTSHRANKDRHTKKGRWVESLKREGRLPVLKVLEETTEDCKRERELAWIYEYLQLGAPLTNNGTDIQAARAMFRAPPVWDFVGIAPALWAVDERGNFHLLSSPVSEMWLSADSFQIFTLDPPKQPGIFEGSFVVERIVYGTGSYQLVHYRATPSQCIKIRDLSIASKQLSFEV